MSTRDVLVVGAGPTGLLAAAELRRRGVDVRVVDRAEGPATTPRALSLWPRALDILADLGVGDRITAGSRRIDAFAYFTDRRPLARFAFPADMASRILPQPRVEAALAARLRELGGSVERGVRLLALEEDDLVDVLLEHPGGRLERARARYVIGADGGRSTVRGQLGAGFLGSTYETAFALVDTHIEGPLPTDEIRYYQSGTGALVIVPAPGGVFRFLHVLPGGRGDAGLAAMQAVVDERGPRGVRLVDPVWRTVFRVHARRATDFARGRVFLAGDAAHVHSPAGGQGMNNGLQDAHNLAWKLAAVLAGDSPPALLDSYGPERAEATRRIVRDTDLQTRLWTVRGRLRTPARDAAFRVLDRTGLVSRAYAPVMAGRRLAYPPTRDSQRPARRTACRWPGVRVGGVLPRGLVPPAEPPGWTLVAVAGADPGWPDRLARLAAGRARVVPLAPRDAGCAAEGYLLVRPDGHVEAHGHREDTGRLAAELDRHLVPRRDPVVADRPGGPDQSDPVPA